MKTAHRYILEPYKGVNTRHRCPICQQMDKTYSLYIDTETGKHIHPKVGRCNREINCGYHYPPKQYFQDNNITFGAPHPKVYTPRPRSQQSKSISFIPIQLFKASLKAYETNHFVKFLIIHFGFEVTCQLISRYFIGTSKHWKGATVFWQIDIYGKIRTGKIMLYNPSTGKRVKNIEPAVYWAHSALKQPEFKLRQCLFGEHLLIDKTKPVAIVESEKTAVIASVYFPQYIWLAVGGADGLNFDKLSVIKNRLIFLFPDLKMFERWKLKSIELMTKMKGVQILVFEYLEIYASAKDQQFGLDIADYLIKYNIEVFQENLKKSN